MCSISRGSIAIIIYIYNNMKKKNAVLIPIGEIIRQTRKRRGYSQEEFAQLIQLERSYYSGIERGLHNLSLLIFIRIAKGLDVKIDELVPDNVYELLDVQQS